MTKANARGGELIDLEVDKVAADARHAVPGRRERRDEQHADHTATHERRWGGG
jgi:hypothetical protein